jgi:hypothetical protein
MYGGSATTFPACFNVTLKTKHTVKNFVLASRRYENQSINRCLFNVRSQLALRGRATRGHGPGRDGGFTMLW